MIKLAAADTVWSVPPVLGINFCPFLFTSIYYLVHSILAQHNDYSESYQPRHSRWSSLPRMGQEQMDWHWEKISYLRRSTSIYRGSSLESSSSAVSIHHSGAMRTVFEAGWPVWTKIGCIRGLMAPNSGFFEAWWTIRTNFDFRGPCLLQSEHFWGNFWNFVRT